MQQERSFKARLERGEVSKQDLELLGRLTLFHPYRYINKEKYKSSKRAVVEDSIYRFSEEELYLYNSAVDKSRRQAAESVLLGVGVTLAGLVYSLAKTPVHQRVWGKTLKFLGLGLILGYSRFRLGSSQFEETVDSLYKSIAP